MMRVAAFALIASAGAAAADTFPDYSAQGCVIAPGVIRAPEVQQALDAGHATVQGDWVLIGPALCKIAPPVIDPVLSATDADVAPFISAVDAYPDAPGCFLDAEAMKQKLEVSRGWSETRAHREYVRMISAGIFSGEWRFFGLSPLATPMGFQLMTGACAQVPDAQKIAKSHSDMIASFDGFIRKNAQYLPCETGGHFDYSPWHEFYETLGQGPIINAWQAYEVSFALHGSDWVTWTDMKDKGMPRPPVCSFDGLIEP
ncbi:hypothetical protein GGR95_003243 [Sulfitobacter undariae]|uniref:Uncharacterized protein n=1 Tax=Sulfitobacter undariae TaxID=1563671 RepID=A0A7W6E6D6_9RHOB|nr:hypothetical protein [Sulfitobacter undariae]MBB3995586.1 hypothetical protein [Sulfitobacter undariae]